jgi:hypothetical protein
MEKDLHKLFNEQKRYSFSFDNFLHEIPLNGIYIFFEKGEKYGDYDRIVRVGTHRGQNQLHSRLFQHFKKKNHRRSIFRKNIGRCILNKTNRNYLTYWNLPITAKVDKEKNYKLLDLEIENKIEMEICQYFQENFTFSIFEVNTKEERLHWESKIIATIAQATGIKPSLNWLGNFSPNEKIKTFGLWQIQGLKKPKLNQIEFENLKIIVNGQ